MKKTFEKKGHGKTIVMHFKRHHKKYLFGAFGGFAIVKMVLLFFGLSPVLNIGNIFANDDNGIILDSDNLTQFCEIGGDTITCKGDSEKDISGIKPGVFESYSDSLKILNLSGNKITNIEPGTFNSLTLLTELHLENNQIFDISTGAFDGVNNELKIFTDSNCLSDEKIGKLSSVVNVEQNWQKICLYVDYDMPKDQWTNSDIKATLTLIGNGEGIQKYNLQNEKISFDTNTTKYFDVEYLVDQQEEIYAQVGDNRFDIINYPDNYKISATVNWIDNIGPKCGTWTYESDLNTWSTGITATLFGSIDTGAGISVSQSGGTCIINQKNTPCLITITDKLGNESICRSSGTAYIDREKPTIDIDTTERSNSSHSIKVLVSDDDSGLEPSSLIMYKRQENGGSCGSNGYTPKILTENRYTYVSANDNSNGVYYLCIKGNSLSDNAGNINDEFKFGPFSIDNSVPNCTRQTPTKLTLNAGEGGEITLRCTDTQGIATKNLSSSNIEYNENVVTLSNNAITGAIENGIIYTFTYTALGSGTTSLVLKTGVIEDLAENGNNSIRSQSITVANEHTSAADLIEFPIQIASGWTKFDNLQIRWKNGATGGYDYFDDNDVTTKDWTNIPYIIPSNFSNALMLSFYNYLHNNKYVCAFGQVNGEEPQTICSEHKIQIDYEDPQITISSPINNSSHILGSDITLKWSGNDYGYSGISGYILSINKPSGPLNPIALGPNTTQRNITLDETGTWIRSVTIRDHAFNSGVASGIFYVVTSSEPPVINGDLGNLIEFPVQLLNGWAKSDSLRIEWLSGAIGGYDYFDDNDVTTKDWANIPYIIPSNFNNILKLSFNNYLYNNKYICAFGEISGYAPQTICSDYKIQIDYEIPEITIISPSNYDNFLLGSGIVLKWSGTDYGPSGLSGYTLNITKPSGPLNPIALGPNTTQRNVTLNETGTWRRSVTVKDNALNSGVANGIFYVVAANEPPVINGNLIEFSIEVAPTWVQEDVVKLELYQGANGGYAYFNTNDIGVIDWSGGFNTIPASGFINLSPINNGEYICAFGSKRGATQSVCSEHPIRIDNTNPNILLEYPSDGSDFKKGTNLILSWSGWDLQSGISGYTLKVKDSSGDNISYDFGSNTTEEIINLDKVGTRYRSVAAYDKTYHSTTSYTGYFYVSDDGVVPENGFYLISPSLGEQLILGNDVVLSWHRGTVNNGYEWEVNKISGNNIASGNTDSSTAAVSNSYFATGAYSWSAKDIASDTIKSIPVFYVVDGSDIPDLEVRQFEFDEIEDADLDEYYKSNTITINGLSDGWYVFARLGSGIGALYINEEFVGTEGFVKNGDEIYIEMKASDEYDETVKTTLFVGVGENVVSGDFKVTTRNGIHSWDNSSLTPMQKLWGIVYIDSLIEMYQYDKEKLATFLSTFMQLLQDKSDYYADKILEAEENGDDELAQQYRLYKEAIDFLYITVKYRYDNLEVEDHSIYIAPNGKQYLVEYDENRMAYTSPDFVRAKYFPTRELFKNHIDLNNPAIGKWGIVGNVITTHNGKVYTIYEKNGKWTSSNFKTAKYFDTKEDIINHILANNPASDWNHRIDTDFDEVRHTAPNGRVYRIFKTSSKGNNPDMYSSYDFVNAKYFTSLEAAKKFIDQNNPKK